MVKHHLHCNLLETDNRDHFSVKYGVNRLSILDSLPSFDVTTCLPQDIMHVILEGALPRNCSRLLHHCIQQKYFSLCYLNEVIVTFDYGNHEKVNAPRPIDRDRIASLSDKLGQSGKLLCA